MPILRREEELSGTLVGPRLPLAATEADIPKVRTGAVELLSSIHPWPDDVCRILT